MLIDELPTIALPVTIPTAARAPRTRTVRFYRDLRGDWRSEPVVVTRLGAGRMTYARAIVLADRADRPRFAPQHDLRTVVLGRETIVSDWLDPTGHTGSPVSARIDNDRPLDAATVARLRFGPPFGPTFGPAGYDLTEELADSEAALRPGDRLEPGPIDLSSSPETRALASRLTAQATAERATATWRLGPAVFPGRSGSRPGSVFGELIRPPVSEPASARTVPQSGADGSYRARLLEVATRAIAGQIEDINIRRDGSLVLLNAGKEMLWTGFSPEAEMLKGLIVRVDETGRAVELVAGCLPKFYNHSENEANDAAFFAAAEEPGAHLLFTEKADGSNLRPYWHPDRGRVEFATRGMLQISSGAGGFLDFSAVAAEIAREKYPALLDPELIRRYSLVCELIEGKLNQIVTAYGDRRDLPVITVIDLSSGNELNREAMLAFCARHGLSPIPALRPSSNDFFTAIADFRAAWSETDQEGTVVSVERPGEPVPFRLKVKSLRYLALMRMRNYCTLRRTRELIEANDLRSWETMKAYLLGQFPELPEEVQMGYRAHQDTYLAWEARVYARIAALIATYGALPLRDADQKSFALSIADHPDRSALFILRNQRDPALARSTLDKLIRRQMEDELVDREVAFLAPSLDEAGNDEDPGAGSSGSAPTSGSPAPLTERRGDEPSAERSGGERSTPSSPAAPASAAEAAQLDADAFRTLLLATDLTPLAEALEVGRFETLLPGLRAELDFAQRTRWHALSVLRHSVAVAELLPADFEIRLTGLLHDLGKQRQAAPNAKGEDSYLGHPEAGARLVGPYLAALGLDPATQARMVRRIARHMDLHQAARDARSTESLDKVLDRLGEDLGPLSDLALADTASMSPRIVEAKLAEHREFQVRLAARAAERGLAAWPVTLVEVEAHPAAAAAVTAGTAYVVDEAATAAAMAARDRELLTALALTPAVTTSQPALALIAGLPVSGKSTLARRLTASVPSLAHVSSDAVRMHLTGNRPTYSGPESYLVHRTVGRLAALLLAEGYSVLVDATGVRPRDRRTSLAIAGEDYATAVVWCNVNEATATARFAARAKGLDGLDRSEAGPDTRERMAAVATPPTADEASLVLIVRPETTEAALVQLRDFFG
jgi:predicted kinase